MNISDRCVAGAVSLLNAGGRTLQRAGWVPTPLTAKRLLADAQRRAGASDFGEWAIEEPLERLLAAYAHEADLTQLGRLTAHEMLVSLLENLLALEAERQRQPQLVDAPVTTPVFIVGLPRTGTTLLHSLLAEDSANRTPATWEVMFPAGYAEEPSAIAAIKRRTARRLEWANRFAPDFRRIHPMAPDLPQECIAITAMVLRSIQFHTTHNVATYEDWFERNGHGPAYAFHRRLLQHLQARRGPSRWVLKAPGHLFGLDDLLQSYPDARIVQTHRDPLKVMASMASHATVLRRAFSDRVDPIRVAQDWAQRWGDALDRFLAVRDRSPASQFIDIDYLALERDPLAVVEHVYDFLRWPLTATARQAMSRFLAANPKHKQGAHRYSLESYGLSPQVELKRFARYCERFAIKVRHERT